ncbi:MAG: hypothetical protein WD512_16285 [Candidatus Paceibacterota bacterium]
MNFLKLKIKLNKLIKNKQSLLSIMEIIDIKERVELMNKHHQIEVLRMLKQNSNVVLNENSNGIFINLTDLDSKVIKKIEDYIKYVENQTNNINVIENQKELIENTFFKGKGNKDNSNIKLAANDNV